MGAEDMGKNFRRMGGVHNAQCRWLRSTLVFRVLPQSRGTGTDGFSTSDTFPKRFREGSRIVKSKMSGSPTFQNVDVVPTFFIPKGYWDGGQSRIRTCEGVSQRIYSPPRLATSVSTHITEGA